MSEDTKAYNKMINIKFVTHMLIILLTVAGIAFFSMRLFWTISGAKVI